MASTEIWIVKRRNRAMSHYADVSGAAQGALYIWYTMEEKYLPSMTTGLSFYDSYVHRIPYMVYSEYKQECDKLWKIPYLPGVPEDERIVFASCGDYVYVAYNDLPKVAEAYRSVEFSNDHMKKYADVLDRIHSEFTEKNVIGVYTLQTSVISISDTVAEYSKTDREHQRPHMRKDALDLMETLKK